MTILYVDDERSAHSIFAHSLGEYEGRVDVSYHLNYQSAMDYAKSHPIDCAFLDISLLDKDGITLARDLRTMQPQIEFVFITGYEEFARAAYEVGGRASVTKPYSDVALHEALERMERLTQPWKLQKSPITVQTTSVVMKTFGSFDLLLDGVPVYFKYSKAKELLAFWVHQMGGSVTSAQIFYALWDHQAYTRDNSTYVRRAIRLLKSELEALGIGDIMISQRNSTRVDTEKFTCDAYELIAGNKEVADTFTGEYMTTYPWAQTGVRLLRRATQP